jgi:hypothetical protein|tara:strand:- start:84 stop:224 length:141 start_codon:yes stop_codon:yes gene_type:complete
MVVYARRLNYLIMIIALDAVPANFVLLLDIQAMKSDLKKSGRGQKK